MSTSTLLPATATPAARGALRARVAAGALALVTTVTGAAALTAAAPAGAAAPGCTLRAHAFASRFGDGSQGHSGPSANLRVCADRGGIHRHNRTAGFRIPNVAHIGAVTSRVVTRHSGSGQPYRITAQTHTGRVVLLGAVHARGIVARATATSRRHRKLVGVTTFEGLTLQGRNLPDHAKPNQRYTIPKLGTLILNAQHRVRRGRRLTITVTALKLVVGKANAPGQAPGVMVVGRNTASVLLPRHG